MSTGAIIGRVVWGLIIAGSLYGMFQRRGLPASVGAAVGFAIGFALEFFSIFLLGAIEWTLSRRGSQTPTDGQPTWQNEPAPTAYGEAAGMQNPMPAPAYDSFETPDVAQVLTTGFDNSEPSAPAPKTESDVQRRLAELESYLQQGVITQKEYNQMRRDALRNR